MVKQEPTSAEETQSQKGPSDNLRLLIEGLLEEHNFLHEYRLQKLVYLAELLYAERTDGDNLTDANFKPYRYGAYSEDVKKKLKEISKNPEIKAEYNRKYGNDTCTYKPNNLNKNLPKEINELIEVVLNLSRHVSNEDLAKWSKSTYLFKETDYDDEMNFKDYIDYLRDNNEPDWKGLV